MKRKKYRKILKQLRERVFRATITAQDESEPHSEEVTVIQWSDVVDVLWKNLREKGRK